MKLKSFEPDSGNLLGEVDIASDESIKQSIDVANKQQLAWDSVSLNERVKIIADAFKSLIAFQDELATLLCREMGKNYGRGVSEVRGAIFSGGYYAKEAAKALVPRADGSNIEYRALGVCAVISPWNYPLAMAVNLMVPALVAGNTVIFKPSEETPLVAERFVSLLNQALPEGILQILHGDGSVGRALVESKDIHMVAFTGSLATGRQIMQAASVNLKRLVMELGGNDPMIVLEDADIDAAARFAVAASFENAGQMCTSTERIYVDSKVCQRFVDKVTAIAAQYRLGKWDEQSADIGPLINQKQVAKVKSHIDDALDKGATLLLGGNIQQERFIEPTVLTGLQPDMVMEQEETFGPVVAIAEVDDIEQAITRANNVSLGLGAVVFGHKMARPVVGRLQAGMIGINKGPGGSGDSPWVGAKQSGFGFHGGVDGHRQFAQVTVVG